MAGYTEAWIRMAAEAGGYRLEPGRAAHLARDLNQAAGALAEAGRLLALEDEPATFELTLERLAEPDEPER